MTNLRRVPLVLSIALALVAVVNLRTQPAAKAITVTLTEGTSMAAALSPDGRTLAIDLLGSLWTLPASGGAARRLTEDYMDARQPTWSPDGARVAFQAYRDGNWHVWSIAAGGSDLKPLTWGPFDDREPHWSPDGSRVAFSSDRAGNYDVWELALATGELTRVTTNPANDFGPAWSPDGREIAFVSDRRDSPGVWAIRDGAERQIANVRGSVNGPSWSPDGRVIFNAIADNRSRLVLDGKDVTSNEDVFPFRAQWMSTTEILYTADGRIKRRAIGGGDPQPVAFTAQVSFTREPFTPKRRAFPQTGPQTAMGVMHPAISPDGRRIAFTALGDLWMTPVGGAAERVTRTSSIEIWPAWSPDGRQIAFSSDRAGTMDLWIRDLTTGADRRLTELAGAEMAAAWSPDSARIAFLADGEVFTVDARSGAVKKVHDRLFDPGRPSWSPDGRALLLSVLKPYSTRFREGTNQVLVFPVDGGPDRLFDPVPHRSAGVREDYGPVWSPDGTQMAVAIDGVLAVVPVGRGGEPIGPPRRLSVDLANSPSWTADSRRILYQTTDRLKLVSLDDGETREIVTNVTWAPKVVTGRVVVHGARVFDGRTPSLQDGLDIVIEGNRIRRVERHRADLHGGGTLVDATGLTAMPGLIEMHSHQAKEYGEALGRIWLSFGITTVRNPATNPFEGIEDREAVESGARIGPRIFTTGNPFDGTRIYYAGGTSLDGGAQLDLEIERARRLGFDLVKTYVRLPDLLQKRIIAFAHRHGMPVTSHELYPAAAYGADGVEHIRGTSRRGYSPKVTALNRSYRDVIDLLAASKMTITPTIGIQGGFQLLTLRDASWMDDPRIRTLFPASATAPARQFLERERGSDVEVRAAALRPLGEMVLAVTKAGGRIVAGTDSPIIPYGLSLHTELEHYVAGGLTPFQALQTATVIPAEALGMSADLGTIEPGKLADLAIVDGDPLADVRHARKVRRVIKDGEVFALEDLLKRPAVAPAELLRMATVAQAFQPSQRR